MTYPKTFVSKYLEQETKFSDIAKVRKALFDLRQSYLVVKRDQEFSLVEHPSSSNLDTEVEFASFLPSINPSEMGDPEFCKAHNVNAAYVAGAMANGIGSAEICIAMGKAGMLGFLELVVCILERLKKQFIGFSQSWAVAPTDSIYCIILLSQVSKKLL